MSQDWRLRATQNQVVSFRRNENFRAILNLYKPGPFRLRDLCRLRDQRHRSKPDKNQRGPWNSIDSLSSGQREGCARWQPRAGHGRFWGHCDTLRQKNWENFRRFELLCRREFSPRSLKVSSRRCSRQLCCRQRYYRYRCCCCHPQSLCKRCRRSAGSPGTNLIIKVLGHSVNQHKNVISIKCKKWDKQKNDLKNNFFVNIFK